MLIIPTSLSSTSDTQEDQRTVFERSLLEPTGPHPTVTPPQLGTDVPLGCHAPAPSLSPGIHMPIATAFGLLPSGLSSFLWFPLVLLCLIKATPVRSFTSHKGSKEEDPHASAPTAHAFPGISFHIWCFSPYTLPSPPTLPAL